MNGKNTIQLKINTKEQRRVWGVYLKRTENTEQKNREFNIKATKKANLNAWSDVNDIFHAFLNLDAEHTCYNVCKLFTKSQCECILLCAFCAICTKNENNNKCFCWWIPLVTETTAYEIPIHSFADGCFIECLQM